MVRKYIALIICVFLLFGGFTYLDAEATVMTDKARSQDTDPIWPSPKPEKPEKPEDDDSNFSTSNTETHSTDPIWP